MQACEASGIPAPRYLGTWAPRHLPASPQCLSPASYPHISRKPCPQEIWVRTRRRCGGSAPDPIARTAPSNPCFGPVHATRPLRTATLQLRSQRPPGAQFSTEQFFVSSTLHRSLYHPGRANGALVAVVVNHDTGALCFSVDGGPSLEALPLRHGDRGYAADRPAGMGHHGPHAHDVVPPHGASFLAAQRRDSDEIRTQ